jgi:hypothetical protein
MSSLYSTSVGADTPSLPLYHGCFNTTSNPKALVGFSSWLGSALSVSGCRAVCSAKGYLLAGMENAECEFRCLTCAELIGYHYRKYQLAYIVQLKGMCGITIQNKPGLIHLFTIHPCLLLQSHGTANLSRCLLINRVSLRQRPPLHFHTPIVFILLEPMPCELRSAMRIMAEHGSVSSG